MGVLSLKYLLFAFIILLCSFKFQDKLWFIFHRFTFIEFTDEPSLPRNVYTAEMLRKFDGVTDKKLYLALLGNVFDVSIGQRHYSPEGAYHYFVGKDGSRSFITGDFQDDGENKDHVLDLSCDELSTLDHWIGTMKEKYTFKGFLIGRYYDRSGEETGYSKQLHLKRQQCELEKTIAENEKLKHPSCNIEWNIDVGSRVWCSKASGGASRNWVGVPRQLYSPGEEHPRCVCVNTKELQETDSKLLKEYDNCDPTSTSCKIAS